MWLFHTLEEKIQRRKFQKVCVRCGILYLKTCEECPHCSEIKDYNLKLLLKERAKFRVGLGKFMLFGAAVIMAFLLLISR